MSYELFIALIGFAFVTSVTPGPNNLMLMASGANFGLRRTVPHMLGVSLGHAFMAFILGLGLAELFAAQPRLRLILTAISAVYLLWLAWKIANAAAPGSAASAGGQPLTWLQAAGFQWVNPKAVYMAVTAQTLYAPDGSGWIGAALVAGIFAAVNLPSVGVWAWAGTHLRRLLTDSLRLQVFNITMAVLLIASFLPVLFP